MSAPPPISKTNASFPSYLNFQGLRKLGIEHCQSLGSDLWTDFNLHDPGLTILETLCYALTDLGYRTNFPIEDLLARGPKQGADDQAATGADEAKKTQPFDDNFFTPEQILSCNPVTLFDLRKLLIDIPGVRNAWIEPANTAEVALYYNDDTRQLQYAIPADVANDAKAIEGVTVTPDGLYIVCLELDRDVEADACSFESIPVGRIVDHAWALLHHHRNLCEDVIDIVVLGDEEIALCVDIEIDAVARPEDVLLGIYRKLDEFLSPTLNFYTLKEMLARGKSIEDIYAGRPLAPLASLSTLGGGDQGQPILSHGFIDSDELAATERRTRLHLSDLYREIMSVTGVLAVHQLLGVNYVNGIAQTDGEKWCLHLTPKHRQRFSLARSRIKFFKGVLPFSVATEEVERRYQEERDARTKAPMKLHQLDQAVPAGVHRELTDYRSIIHEFPLVYGIGEGGLPDTASTERKAQVRQLRAYLLLYDQIMANYLAQLSKLRELFSIRPDRERGDNRSYFTQVLSDIPRIDELLRNYNRCESEDGYPPVPENYPDYLNFLVESEETYHDRRNRFLDHLLARFAESFTDYVLLMFDVNGQRNDQRQVIRDKVGFLSSYPEISRDRGRGFDYHAAPVWNTNQVTGLEKRVARLLGFGRPECRTPLAAESQAKSQTWQQAETASLATKALLERIGEPFLRRSLSSTRVVEVESGWHWSIDLELHGSDTVTLHSRQRYINEVDAGAALDEFRALATDERNYRRLSYEDGFDHYGFAVVGPGERVLAEVEMPWPSSQTRDCYLHRLMQLAIAGGIACELDQATECHFYQLLDARREQLLFTAVKGYSSADAARAVFDKDFLPAARDGSCYSDIDDRRGHGFELLSKRGAKDQVLATHSQRYATADERRLRKLAILHYLDQPEPRYRIDGTPGVFGFEMSDADGERLLESIEVYPTETAAIAVYRELVEQTHHRGAYRRIDDVDLYGFMVLGADGEPLARHPVEYPTAVARDLSIDWLVRLFCPREEVRHAIRKRGYRRYSVTLLAEDSTKLLVSAATHVSEGAATYALRVLLDRAGQRDSYTLIDDHGAYGFALMGSGKEVLALHKRTYVQAIERDIALRGLISYVCPASVDYAIKGEPGCFHYQLLDPNDKTALFRGVEAYGEAASAKEAFQTFLGLAVDRGSYYPIDGKPGYGFELRGDTCAVAVHPDCYRTIEEREAAIAMIIAYLSRAEPQSRIDNPTGAFRFEIHAEHGEPVLLGTQVLESHSAAKQACREARALARARERYQRTLTGSSACCFGFAIVDAERNPVAEHPRRYVSADERDQAMKRLYALVHDGSTIPDVVEPEIEYGFQLRAHNGSILLESIGTFPTPKEARDAFEQVRKLAADAKYTLKDGAEAFTFELRYVADRATPENESAPRLVRSLSPALSQRARETKENTVTVLDEGQLVDLHPLVYTRSAERDVAIAATRFTVRSGGAPFAIVEPCAGHFSFQYLGPEQQVALVAAEPTTDRLGAFEQLLASHERAIELDAYCLEYDESGFGYHLDDSDGHSLAEHPRRYPSAEERDQALRDWHTYLSSWVLEPKLVEVEVRFFHQLVDFEEIVLLRSTEHWPTAQQAERAFRKRLVPVARDESKYLRTYVNQECCYSFGLPDLAEHPKRCEGVGDAATDGYPSPRLRDQQLQAAVDLLRAQSHDCDIPGVACGHFFRLSGDGHELVGTSYHPDAARAAAACTALLPRLTELEAYVIEEVDRGAWRLTVSDAEGVIAAATKSGDYASLITLRDALMALAAEPTALPHQLSETAPEFRYRLSDADGGLLLESMRGYPVDQEKAREAACDAANTFVERAQDPGGFRLITASGGCAHGFEVIAEDRRTLARFPYYFECIEQRDAMIAAIRCLVDAEGFHLIEHLLLRPRESVVEPAYGVDMGNDSEQPREALIPLGGGCRDEDGHLCPVRSDPYSFRVTIVVPYWPRRFRHSDFRPFFERTLRLETPAHIFPRICWLDVCQMQAFEDAYRRWLETLARPAGDCGRVAAQRALVKILFDLNSIYGTARLTGCGSDQPASPLRLDQSILGTAGEENGDSS